MWHDYCAIDMTNHGFTQIWNNVLRSHTHSLEDTCKAAYNSMMRTKALVRTSPNWRSRLGCIYLFLLVLTIWCTRASDTLDCIVFMCTILIIISCRRTYLLITMHCQHHCMSTQHIIASGQIVDIDSQHLISSHIAKAWAGFVEKLG